MDVVVAVAAFEKTPFDLTLLPEQLQTFFVGVGNEQLWISFQSLIVSTRSLADAVMDVKNATRKIKETILSVLEKVHNTHKDGITEDFRRNLLLYVLSQINMMPISQFDGGEKSIHRITAVPNYIKYYNIIRDGYIRLTGKSKLITTPEPDEKKAILSIEFMVDDEEGSFDFFCESKSLVNMFLFSESSELVREAGSPKGKLPAVVVAAGVVARSSAVREEKGLFFFVK